ncbi:30S ribosomal protein S4 [Candidatus Woesearchaeota archaeon]|nr:30S ribosomal protein S4 [Candidatus Woesearchaeota archaeon]
MGSIKKLRKKYETPAHPWRRERLEVERKYVNEYGLTTKKDFWKMQSALRGFTKQAKKLASLDTIQSKKEEEQLLKKMNALGLLGENAVLRDVLTLNFKDVLNRRLQTIVYKKSLARTPKQARQFIVHGHISLGEQKMTVPSYFVKRGEETLITFVGSSPISKSDHPERIQETKESEMKRKSTVIKEENASEDKEKKKKSKKKVENGKE